MSPSLNAFLAIRGCIRFKTMYETISRFMKSRYFYLPNARPGRARIMRPALIRHARLRAAPPWAQTPARYISKRPRTFSATFGFLELPWPEKEMPRSISDDGRYASILARCSSRFPPRLLSARETMVSPFGSHDMSARGRHQRTPPKILDKSRQYYRHNTASITADDTL